MRNVSHFADNSWERSRLFCVITLNDLDFLEKSYHTSVPVKGVSHSVLAESLRAVLTSRLINLIIKK